MAEWHRRAVGLQAELQKLQSQIQENQRLRWAGRRSQAGNFWGQQHSAL